MTIEKTLERIADALETIAVAVGELAEDDTPDLPEPPKKKAPAKKAAKKNQVQVGTDDEVDDSVTKEDVRAKLTELQKATSPAQAKSILKAEGAGTIGNLAVSKYQRVIDACDKILAEQ